MKIKVTILILCIVGILFFLNSPIDFPVGGVFRVEQGESLHSVSLKLKQDHVIRSRLLFEIFAIMMGGEKHIEYSDYLFESKLPVYEIARRIVRGEHHMVPLSVTIPEGYNLEQISEAFSSKLNYFNKENFINLAKVKEGYLFPDTYFIANTDNEKDVVNMMSSNFEKKISPLRTMITAGGKTEKDIITMASIIEGEAKGVEDRGVISGILWHRISIGMPLQVDVALETYKIKGLPKSPVGNPGLLAIQASISPTSSPYLYYLHDKNGNIHYAKTFSEHEINRLKYLK